MAVIQYTGAVNQIRGKLNGSTFNKSRTAFTLQSKQQAPRSFVGLQSEARNQFSTAQRTWKTLSDVQRANWQLAADNNPARDRFGDQVILSGYNQYIKAHMRATAAGVTPPSDPDTNPAPDAGITSLDFSDLSLSVNMQGLVLADATGTYTPIVPNDEMVIMLSMGLPVSQGVTVYHGRYVNITADFASLTGSLSGSRVMSLRWPMVQTGQLVPTLFEVFYRLNGALVLQTYGMYAGYL